MKTNETKNQDQTTKTEKKDAPIIRVQSKLRAGVLSPLLRDDRA